MKHTTLAPNDYLESHDFLGTYPSAIVVEVLDNENYLIRDDIKGSEPYQIELNSIKQMYYNKKLNNF